MSIQLANYDNSWYRPGGTLFKRAAWFFLGQPLVRSAIIPSSSLRVFLLRIFGARIGRGVVIKPAVEIKYPWHLIVGDDSWIGEHAWIDNLTTVQLGSNVCISQGSYFCTGNHDWSDPRFGLRVSPIHVGDGAWVGAKSMLTPGVVLGAGAVAAAGLVVTRPIPPFEIHAGNPARFVKARSLKMHPLAAGNDELFTQASDRVQSDAEAADAPHSTSCAAQSQNDRRTNVFDGRGAAVIQNVPIETYVHIDSNDDRAT